MPEAVDALVTLSKGDMRRALNVLQACYASSELLQPQVCADVESLTICQVHLSNPKTV
jgi:DNA polymerase III delta prime subunit